ncbi:MAG: cytochrome b N-terminal domain-containing protein [Actinomycetota bacterium]|nr:cytochrome b N-terminal domain-containing protein [Actinomycetota bacterium]
MNQSQVRPDRQASGSQQEIAGSGIPLTTRLRNVWLRYLPPEKMLPDHQPAYVASWVYVFGVLTLSGLLVAVLSGLWIAVEGPTWWHISAVGHFVNSLHLWSVELFMGFMALHLWAKFWMAAWRGKRSMTWISGVAAFLVSIVEAFTGYLSQTNFDSQWVSFESKDAFNGSGLGAFFNAMNFGQALMLHIVLLPLVLVSIVGVHLLLVRLKGVVRPFPGRKVATGAPVDEPGRGL